MEKIDIILWILSGGFAATFGLMTVMNKKIDKLDEKLTDVDRRLCRLEGAFSTHGEFRLVKDKEAKGE